MACAFLAFAWFYLSNILPVLAHTLVPTKRVPSLETRARWSENLHPKNYARISYGMSESHFYLMSSLRLSILFEGPYHPPNAHVTFEAHDEYPVLVLEDIDHLLDLVLCSAYSQTGNASILLAFRDQETYREALLAWGGLEHFTLITAHTTCNPDGEHAAWLYVHHCVCQIL